MFVEPVPPLGTVSAFVRFKVPIQAVVEVKRVEVALVKVSRPVKELLFESKVEDAAVIVPEEPRAIGVELMVIVEFWSWLLPMVLVETNEVPL